MQGKVLMKYMKPRKSTTESYPKISAHKQLANLVTICQEPKVINYNEAKCVVFNPPPPV